MTPLQQILKRMNILLQQIGDVVSEETELNLSWVTKSTDEIDEMINLLKE